MPLQNANDDAGASPTTPATALQVIDSVNARDYVAIFETEDLSKDEYLLQARRAPYKGIWVPWLGKHPIIKRLGIGGMGAVYYAVHPRLPMNLAIKVLRSTQPDAVKRFMQEAQVAASINSDNVVVIKDVEQELGIHYIVMEFVHGKSAQQLLNHARANGNIGLDESTALEIIFAACKGLKAAHAANIIHRDNKPDNILVPYGSGG